MKKILKRLLCNGSISRTMVTQRAFNKRSVKWHFVCPASVKCSQLWGRPYVLLSSAHQEHGTLERTTTMYPFEEKSLYRSHNLKKLNSVYYWWFILVAF